MIQLGILLTQQHRLLSVAAMLDVFETTNQFYQQDGQEPRFRIALLHPATSHPIAYGGHPLYGLETAPSQDIILIPAFGSDNIPEAVAVNSECFSWLRQQYRQGAEIASCCSGAFLLAATGLLDQKPATTHIQSAQAFAQAFPQVRLKSAEIITFEDGIYTSGGATNSFHLLLRVVEKYCGRSMAVRIAKYFAIDMDREQQAYFGTFQPVQTHSDELVSALQRRIEERFSGCDNIEALLSEIPASRRNLVRRFKHATGITPIEYLQKTRIEAAKRLLESTDQTVLGVMMGTGYNDLKAFRQVFRKATGMTPTDYRKRFSRKRMDEAAA